jgi:CRISPR-associated endonuclease/helicase Cas3
LCLLPVLADSAVVIDEVHSFDRRLFDNLVSFLREFHVPVLCMTATLPPGRRKELVDCGLRAYPDETERTALDDLVRVEEHPRYRLCRVATEEEALAEALRALGERRQRVLWVVNQVRRCQRLAALLKGHLGQEVLVYHSRFRCRDRQDIHRETIAAFQQQHTPVLAVTTQVCEMSLDLDADVLITELAPLTALVQRFGRAHRKLNRQGDFRARLLYYAPAGMLPYDRADLVDAERALAALTDRDLSQSDLALAIDKLVSRETRADGSSRFTESGYFATPGSLRDADDFTRPCILDKDLEHAEAAHRAKKPLDPWLIDVPERAVEPDASRPAWLPAHLGVAPSERYSEWLGFTADAIDGKGEGA